MGSSSKMKCKKSKNEGQKCDQMEAGPPYRVPQEEVFKSNNWEIFCFPYILFSRVWDCFITACSGTNQCLVYWMMIQFIACKITRLTTPDPIVFPYYFYMFCQVILLTIMFYLLWRFWLHKALVVYLNAFYEAFLDPSVGGDGNPPANTSRMSYRRYCFRKSEIFETMPDAATDVIYSPVCLLAAVTLNFFVAKMFS